MGRMSRQKGKAGERECAAEVTPLFGPARRGVQYAGGPESPDVHLSDSDLHIEVKRTERLNPYRFMDQAVSDSTRTRRAPLVVMRSSHKPWLILCRLDDLPRIAEEVLRARATLQPAMDSAEAV